MKYKRICLYGGPGLGKSVLASKLFAELKIAGHNIELVSEWIKTWAHQKYQLQSFDQFYAFTKQLRREDILLNNNHIDFIVTDSPLLLNVAYTKKYGHEYWEQCLKISLQLEVKFPGIHISLDRDGIDYNDTGRWESLKEARFMDIYINNVLKESLLEYQTFKTIEYFDILEYIKEKLDG